ncbi:uncharacterized protein LOC135821130 [Sycon ciliatum]|uniref:uncharacterized protein LOC135821130 n=1 Tax=Sycon ciliatum TaxID=27933 RepID=UPI0031F6E471
MFRPLLALAGLLLLIGLSYAGDYKHTCNGVDVIVSTTRRYPLQAKSYCAMRGLNMVTFNNMYALNKEPTHCLAQAITKDLAKDSVTEIFTRNYGPYFGPDVYDLQQHTLRRGLYSQQLATVCLPESLDICMTNRSACPKYNICRTPTLTSHTCTSSSTRVNVTTSFQGKATPTDVWYEYADLDFIHLHHGGSPGCKLHGYDYNEGPFSMPLYNTHKKVRATVNTLLKTAGTPKVTVYTRNPDFKHKEFRTFTYHASNDSWTNVADPTAAYGVAICSREYHFQPRHDFNFNCNGVRYNVSTHKRQQVSASYYCEAAGMWVINFQQLTKLKHDSCFNDDVLGTLKAGTAETFWLGGYAVPLQDLTYTRRVLEGVDTVNYAQPSDLHATVCTFRSWRETCDPAKRYCKSGEICQYDDQGQPQCFATETPALHQVYRSAGKKYGSQTWFKLQNNLLAFVPKEKAESLCSRTSTLFGYAGVFNMFNYESSTDIRTAVDKILLSPGLSQLSIYVHGINSIGQVANHYRTFTLDRTSGSWTNVISAHATDGLAVCTAQLLEDFVAESTHTCMGADFHVSANSFTFNAGTRYCRSLGKIMLTYNTLRLVSQNNSCFRESVIRTLRNKGQDKFWVSMVGFYDMNEAYDPVANEVHYDEGTNAVVCHRDNLDTCSTWTNRPCSSEKLCRSTSFTTQVCHDTIIHRNITKMEHGKFVNYTVIYQLPTGTIRYESPSAAIQTCALNQFSHSHTVADPFRMEEYTSYHHVYLAVNNMLKAIGVGIDVFVHAWYHTPPLNGVYHTFRYTPEEGMTNVLTTPEPKQGVVICTSLHPHAYL